MLIYGKKYSFPGKPMNQKKIPTGIKSLDSILHGGFPSGSLVLLEGEIGAGDFEFMLTTASRLLRYGDNNDACTIIPPKLCYLSFTRPTEDILKEVALSFPEYYAVMEESIQQNRIDFKDFSNAYFASSFIPQTWMSTMEKESTLDSLKWSAEEKNLVETLIEYLDENARGNIVIIDSLTALAQYCLNRMRWMDLIMFLRGLQRASKIWDGIIYAMLSEGIFSNSNQEEIAECFDGVIVFKWEQLGPSQRQRTMHFKKFRGVLPVLDEDNIVNFETQINSGKGFEVSNIKRVRGR